MSDKATCGRCGEPMPEGEEMFKYHGYSGECPKEALPKPKLEAVVEYVYRTSEGGFVLDIVIDRSDKNCIGPFSTEQERDNAKADLLHMMREMGAQDLPRREQ